MSAYRVTFRVDVDADDETGAAAFALELLRTGGREIYGRVLELEPAGLSCGVTLPAVPALELETIAGVLEQTFELRGLETIGLRSTDPAIRAGAWRRAAAIRAVDEATR